MSHVVTPNRGIITAKSFLFDSLKTLLVPVLHSLLSAICRLVPLTQLPPRSCIIVQCSQFRPRVYCLPLLIHLRILSHILSRPAGCLANSIQPSTCPNYFERELRRTRGICLTTMVWRHNLDNIKVGSGVREVATSMQYYSNFERGEAEI